MRHILTATAFERKVELGGGFRGIVLDRRTKARHESDVLPTLDAARHWARVKVAAIMGDSAWLPGYGYKPNWQMNVWVEFSSQVS
jgi:hypothetical protein